MSVRLALGGVCLAACLPYLSTIQNYFVADDFGVVQLLASKPWWYFPRWFVSTWMDGIWGFTPDEVRPFPALSYQITSLGPAGSPVFHHLFNIGMHAATAILVLAMARRIAGLGTAAATFAAVIFAILPVQAESVAWITGRVDSMPAFFYIGSFLAYARWREVDAARGAYVWSLVLFGIALFTKQNAITLVGTLLAYEVLMLEGWRRPWRMLNAALPFAVMTLGYLYLRYVLFGEVAREGRLSATELEFFATTVGRHLSHIVFGDLTPRAPLPWIVLATGLVALLVTAARTPGRARLARALLFFGPAWWTIGVAPILVAGYESPRHVYLASAGWAVAAGVVLEVALSFASRPIVRKGLAVAAAAIVLFYAVRLQRAVEQWNAVAAVSHRAVQDLEREVLAAPPGTLFIVDAPVRSWEWALPFAAQPPFARQDLTRRASIVSPMLLHCCRGQWYDHTRQTLQVWLDSGAERPVVALRWTAGGGVMRTTDQADPAIRDYVPILVELGSPEALNSALLEITARTVPANPRPRVAATASADLFKVSGEGRQAPVMAPRGPSRRA